MDITNQPVVPLLRLYVAGATSRSTRAIATVRRLCERYLPGRYRLEVIDVYQQPDRARDDHIIATPTLLIVEPGPPTAFIGELRSSDWPRVAAALNILTDED
ncbi:MAG: circadian clock protein KaiB [Chloroflexus aggregans]|jgi:circadian clock protein KaiB|uniref:Circadian clock protein KaiB n=1 Tax=Chloroflexus aggregans TaxID=152260 RepID=A0A2J6XAN4_9CHLR|nr:MAG: circadian clock protein KaiB [Chloroflexus aggregans]